MHRLCRSSRVVTSIGVSLGAGAVGSNFSNFPPAPWASVRQQQDGPARMFSQSSSTVAQCQAVGTCNSWTELKSDEDVKRFNGAGRVPSDKMKLSIPKGSKGAIAIIACGSFSPPTMAHMRMMEDAKNELEAMGYTVVGGFMSPTHTLYGKKSLVENFHRVNMMGATLAHNDWISVDPWECAQDKWTTTAKVIDRYQKDFDALATEGKTNGQIRACLIGGADLVESFAAKKDNGQSVWATEDVEMIVTRGVICITRAGLNLDDVIAKNPTLANNKDKIHIVNAAVENNISSTLIRKLLQQKKSLKYIVHDEVINYIRSKDLDKAAPWQ